MNVHGKLLNKVLLKLKCRNGSVGHAIKKKSAVARENVNVQSGLIYRQPNGNLLNVLIKLIVIEFFTDI